MPPRDGAASTPALLTRLMPDLSPAELRALDLRDDEGTTFLVACDSVTGTHRVISLPDRDGRMVLTIDAGDGADVVVEGRRTGRPNAALDRLAGLWVLRPDMNADMLVNEVRAGRQVGLEDGDVLRVNGTRLLFRDLTRARRGDGSRAAAHGPRRLSVTEAQRRVLVELARPMFASPPGPGPASNADIASALGVTVPAVKKHLNALVDQFGLRDVPQVHKRARLVRDAQRAGLVRLADFAGAVLH